MAKASSKRGDTARLREGYAATECSILKIRLAPCKSHVILGGIPLVKSPQSGGLSQERAFASSDSAETSFE